MSGTVWQGTHAFGASSPSLAGTAMLELIDPGQQLGDDAIHLGRKWHDRAAHRGPMLRAAPKRESARRPRSRALTISSATSHCPWPPPQVPDRDRDSAAPQQSVRASGNFAHRPGHRYSWRMARPLTRTCCAARASRNRPLVWRNAVAVSAEALSIATRSPGVDHDSTLCRRPLLGAAGAAR